MFEVLAMALLLYALASALESRDGHCTPSGIHFNKQNLVNGYTEGQAPIFAHGQHRCEARSSTSWDARCAALGAIVDSELALGAAELRVAGVLWYLCEVGGSAAGRIGGGVVREVRERARRALEAMEHIVVTASEDI